MSGHITKPFSWFEILALLVLLWGLLSVLGAAEHGVAGYTTGAENRVLNVEIGGAAETAGLLAGDRVIAIDGIPVEDSTALIRLGRSEIGEARELAVERDGEALQIDVTYAAPDPVHRWRRWAALLVGCSFLFFPLRAWRTDPGTHSRVLALMGLGLGLAFMGEPPVTDWTWRSLALLFRHALVLAGIGAALHFLLLYPTPRRFLARPRRAAWLYAPLALYWLLLAWRVVFTPPATGFLYNLTYVAGSMLFGIYGAIGLVTAIRSFIRHRHIPRPNGPRRVLFGLLGGILPAAFLGAASVLARDAELPVLGFGFVFLALVPWAWSTAPMNKAAAGEKPMTKKH